MCAEFFANDSDFVDHVNCLHKAADEVETSVFERFRSSTASEFMYVSGTCQCDRVLSHRQMEGKDCVVAD